MYSFLLYRHDGINWLFISGILDRNKTVIPYDSVLAVYLLILYFWERRFSFFSYSFGLLKQQHHSRRF
jgi:hypothetical protein